MSPIRMSRLESAIRVVLAFNDAFNHHDVAGMMQLVSDDCVFENTGPAPDGTVYSGKEAIAQFWQDFFRESPQAHIEIEEIFSSGFRCIVRWRYDWTDAAGEKGHVRGVDIFKVNGKPQNP
jgi:limonene-1,2-epoxide hydrolase